MEYFTYKYKRKASATGWGLASMTEDGWGLKITDKNSTTPVTEAVCAYINDKPMVNTMQAFNSSKATSIDLSNWYTKNIVQTTNMFTKAEASEIIGLSDFDVSNAYNIGGTFSQMPNITELDLTGWDTRNVTNINLLFQKSEPLQKIYVGTNFDTSLNSGTTGGKLFEGCTSLVGGAGTTYDDSNIGISYARVDDPDNGNPGYFTMGPPKRILLFFIGKVLRIW